MVFLIFCPTLSAFLCYSFVSSTAVWFGFFGHEKLFLPLNHLLDSLDILRNFLHILAPLNPVLLGE